MRDVFDGGVNRQKRYDTMKWGGDLYPVKFSGPTGVTAFFPFLEM